jgi:ankyrin repeat protein
MLATIPSLKTVNVWLTQVTQAGIAEVRAPRPDVVITWERLPNERAGSIHESAQDGDIENVRRVVEGWKLNPLSSRQFDMTDLAGNTPLIYAVGQNHYEVAQYLLDAGARVNFQDPGGAAPLHWATRHGYEKMMQLLLERKANVNSRDEEGNTPLHVAAEKGALEPVRILVALGADVRSRNAAGQTPLDLAGRLGNVQVQEILRSATTLR